MGYINHTLDPDYHWELARLGVWLGWDGNNLFGRPQLPPSQERTDYLKERLDKGLAPSMMLSHDWNIVLSGIGSPGMPSRNQNSDGYLWFSRAFIPTLMDLGVLGNVIDRMMIDNPRRCFEGVRPSD